MLSTFSCSKKNVNNPYTTERNQLKKSIEATDVIEELCEKKEITSLQIENWPLFSKYRNTNE